jgi:diguanylate cyclase (GGDEF)-like protein/PAS domain S-box-containing protein
MLLLCAVADTCVLADTPIQRDPLEERALQDPEQVLAELPQAIVAARSAGDDTRLALLYLAEANACRVVADWNCQRLAGNRARETADRAGLAQAAIRGLIAESRASIAMQDYTRGEQLLADAELRLNTSPSAELSSDIMLAYSSLSHTLGKHALAVDYAERGLKLLQRGEAVPMQVRLLRNAARARAQLGQFEAAQQTLLRAQELAVEVNDPKLSAELYLEAARVARLLKDLVGQRENGAQVLALASNLKNSQLAGLGHEVLGLAAQDAHEHESAMRELTAAYDSFRKLGLARDELRLARLLIGSMLDLPQHPAGLEPLLRRFLELDRTVVQGDRAQASDDFDAKLKYAQQELDVVRLESEAMLSRERETALAATHRLTLLLTLLSIATLLVLGVFFGFQRRSNRHLRKALDDLRASESRATDLLRLSKGFVFLHDADGRLLLVNPATAAALGATPESLEHRPFAEFVPARHLSDLDGYLRRVVNAGEDEGRMVVRQGDGSERHWRYSSRYSDHADRRAYVIAHAFDVTEQVTHTEALREDNRRDALTGLYNRRRMAEFGDAQTAQSTWAVVNIDLDHFKRINDTRGHDHGDQVLIEVAQFLQAQAGAQVDVVRTGGDEFVLLLPDVGQAELDALVARLTAHADDAPCGFSLGAALRLDGETLAATLTRADDSMYSTRRAVRGNTGSPT